MDDKSYREKVIILFILPSKLWCPHIILYRENLSNQKEGSIYRANFLCVLDDRMKTPWKFVITKSHVRCHTYMCDAPNMQSSDSSYYGIYRHKYLTWIMYFLYYFFESCGAFPLDSLTKRSCMISMKEIAHLQHMYFLYQ